MRTTVRGWVWEVLPRARAAAPLPLCLSHSPSAHTISHSVFSSSSSRCSHLRSLSIQASRSTCTMVDRGAGRGARAEREHEGDEKRDAPPPSSPRACARGAGGLGVGWPGLPGGSARGGGSAVCARDSPEGERALSPGARA